MRFGSFRSSALRFFFRTELHLLFIRIKSFSDLFVPYRFQLQKHAAQVFPDHFLFHFEFFSGAFAEQDFLRSRSYRAYPHGAHRRALPADSLSECRC